MGSAAGQAIYSQFSVFKKRRQYTMDAFLEGPADSYEVDLIIMRVCTLQW